MDSSSGDGAGTGGTAPDTMHYPKVVLVTGACRFLGGYLTARLAQNPLINTVIAVDAIAPSKDMLRRMGRAEFVRADPDLADIRVIAVTGISDEWTSARAWEAGFHDFLAKPAPVSMLLAMIRPTRTMSAIRDA